jgi:hypothetical protein
MTLEDKEKNVMRGIVVEFEPQYYDEASALIKKARNEGENIGLIVLNAFRK